MKTTSLRWPSFFIGYFNQVGIVFGAVTWPHEQDIAPETLVVEMQIVELEPA